jgi:[protein-PII] uridylyltransferase
VRTVREAIVVADQDLNAALGLLDARYVAGDERLVAELQTRIHERWRQRAATWIPMLLEAARDRHARNGEVAFLLEPNLKESKGGLRDLTVLRGITTASPTVQLEPTIETAHATLRDVRLALHRWRLATSRTIGTGGDVLSLHAQDAVAESFGIDADALMKLVADAGRVIGWHVDDAGRAISSALAGPNQRSANRPDTPIGPGLVMRDGEIAATDGALSRDAATVLRAAAAWASSGHPIARETLRRFEQGVEPLDHGWPSSARADLVTLLATGEDAIPVLETLDAYGLLTRILPEWSAVRSKPQRNAFHRYTVDRHLMEAAAQAALLTDRVTRPDLLLVGAFFHDLGKGYAGDHTDAGVELMQTILPRIGYGEEDTNTIVALVRLHLLLPRLATTRDVEDPATIQQAAIEVETPERLDLLAALTEADGTATGESAWSDWKAELVGKLVERVHAFFDGETPAPPVYNRPAVPRHQPDSRDVTVQGTKNRLKVIAPDERGLFARVVGLLALHGQDVLGARIGLDDFGLAVEEFDIAPTNVTPIDIDHFADELRRARRGRIAIDARLQARAVQYARLRRAVMAAAPQTIVTIDNEAASHATVIQVHTADEIGVLYRIARTLAELHLDLRFAKIVTLGAEIIDSFYVLDDQGEKIVDPGYLDEVQRALHATLAPAADPFVN